MGAVRLEAQQDLWDLFRLTGEHGPDPLTSYLERVCEFCSRYFLADGVSLFLREDGSNIFKLSAQSGFDRKIPGGAKFKLGEGFAGLAASDGNPILLKDGDPLARTAKRANRTVVGGAMVLPLVTPLGECVGVFNLSRRAAGSKFRDADIQRGLNISQHLALAVANATLVSRLQTLASTNQNIVESLQAAVVSIDPNGLIVEANAQALRLIGKPRAKLEGKSWTDFFTKFSSESVRDIALCVKSATKGKVKRSRISEKPDSHYQICASPTPTGQVTLVIEDVSKSVRQDRQLERSLRLAEIGQMTAAVAHEIRNPLTSIKGAAQMISTESELDEAQKWGQVIAEEADSLNELCTDFLDLAKPISLNPKPTDLVQVLDQLLERMSGEFEKSNSTYNFTPQPNLPIIPVDAARLMQAVRNLVRNAIQSMQGGGLVTVEVAHQKTEKTVEIQIGDEGIGMDAAQVARLFTPFFTTKAQGTGLGLCNVRKIIEAHGGRVFVDSQPGSGSRFTVQLPTGKTR